MKLFCNTSFAIFCLICIYQQTKGLRFLLYTRTSIKMGQECELDSKVPSSFAKCPFCKNKPVKFLTHGYTSVYTKSFPQETKDAYLQVGEYNVIVVDWETLAKAPYSSAVNNARTVGKEIAALITALIDNRYSTIRNFHHIGHSLGAQVGAFISVNLPPNRKIRRVTGLDPANPGFEESVSPKYRLDPTDATLVDVITTSCRVGCKSNSPYPPWGGANFYPNGGMHQPGCGTMGSRNCDICSHHRACELYQASITMKKGFIAYKCATHKNFKNCSKRQHAYMGEHTSMSTSGIYYFETKDVPPFSEDT